MLPALTEHDARHTVLQWGKCMVTLWLLWSTVGGITADGPDGSQEGLKVSSPLWLSAGIETCGPGCCCDE